MAITRQIRSIFIVLILTSSSFAAMFYVGGCHKNGSATISHAISIAPAGSVMIP